ncbi:MAG: DMT family transporter [Pseudomonadales bacterium]
MQQVTVGGIYLCLAMVAAAGIDVAAKLLTADFATPQIVLLRTTLSFPLLLVFCWQRGVLGGLLQPRWGWQLYRGLLTAGANFGFFYGLAYLDLITAVLLAYIAPVLIVLAARPLLGEVVGLRRWLGVLTGFAGVLLVVQPNGLNIHPGMLAVLFSALCWALLSITNRQLRDQVDAAVLTFYTAPVSAVLGFVLMDHWVTPTPAQWSLFLCMAIFGAIAHFLTALAYRHAQAAAIAPLEYTNLIWAALAGWLIWSTVPVAIVWAGGALILLGGYISLRARQ